MKRTINWRRTGYVLSFLMVAGVAARVSYDHIRDVALHGHQSPEVATLLPLAVDGMMLIATLAMAEDKAADRQPRGWARVGFWFGAAVSTAANVAATVVEHGWDWLAIAIAALAPILLLLAIEIVARPGKPRKAPKGQNAPATPEPKASDAEAPNLPAAPVSPAPVGPATTSRGGRPSIPATKGPQGRMVHAETGDPLKERTERRKRNGQ